MKSLTTPIILIVLSIALFFLGTDRFYKDVKVIQENIIEKDKTLSNYRNLSAKLDELKNKRNSFKDTDLLNLERLLPDSVDNVSLLLDIEGLAKQYGFLPRDISIDSPTDKTEANSSKTSDASDKLPYDSLKMSFSVTADYNRFQEFLRQLENSRRLIDITSISLKANGAGSNSTFYDFNITLKTYWLK
jgi:Tfp pilus assembly protein PilO